MRYLYHGSAADVGCLKACSALHGDGQKVVYLTDNIPYALLYIWDEKHNCCAGKHVTGWVKNETAFYEEQFPDQLNVFYKGVLGYLYRIPESSLILKAENNEGIYYSRTDITPDISEYISDVYDELMKYEAEGSFKVRRYNDQTEKRKNELTDMISGVIIRSDFFKNDTVKADFYRKFFSIAWENAQSHKQMQ